MTRPRRAPRWSAGISLVGVVASTVAAAALLGPWVALGTRSFSSLDLISSASALELVQGRRKTMVLVGWMVVPTLTAAGYVLAALGRRRLLAAALAPIGPVYAAILVTLESRSPLQILWGLRLGTAAGAIATVAALALVVPGRLSRSPAT